jgi:hypothetical protein
MFAYMHFQASNLWYSFGAYHIFMIDSEHGKKTIDLKFEIHIPNMGERPK